MVEAPSTVDDGAFHSPDSSGHQCGALNVMVGYIPSFFKLSFSFECGFKSDV